jgi:hypothetical protein
MAKPKTVPAITALARESSLIMRKWEKIEQAAADTMLESEPSATVKIVAAAGRVSGIIEAKGLKVTFQDGAFAADMAEQEGEARTE